jgi:hypothetical protein
MGAGSALLSSFCSCRVKIRRFAACASGLASGLAPASANSWTGWATATTRAALIYQHRTSPRDKMIADEISRRAEAERSRSGTQRARADGQPS